jgi:FtsZ-interacting cell division protein YlmF
LKDAHYRKENDMSDKVRKFLGFLGLVEEDFNDYNAQTGARAYTEQAPVDDWNRQAAPSPAPRAPQLRPVAQPAPVQRVSSISILDANGQPMRPRPVAPPASTMRAAWAGAEDDVELFLPTSFNEAKRVVDVLKVGRAVVLNVVHAEPALRRRYIDFTSGTVCALDGSIETLEKGLVYLVLPRGGSVSPETRARLRAAKYEPGAFA